MNVKHPIHHTELANIAREQARIRRLIHAGARIPALSPEGVVDSVANLFEQIEYLESQLHIKANEFATQLAAATTRADDAERERDAALAVLRDVEYGDLSHPDRATCPSCRWDDVNSHASSCALAACLNGGAE